MAPKSDMLQKMLLNMLQNAQHCRRLQPPIDAYDLPLRPFTRTPPTGAG
jgi:hypothetical protein